MGAHAGAIVASGDLFGQVGGAGVVTIIIAVIVAVVVLKIVFSILRKVLAILITVVVVAALGGGLWGIGTGTLDVQGVMDALFAAMPWA